MPINLEEIIFYSIMAKAFFLINISDPNIIPVVTVALPNGAYRSIPSSFSQPGSGAGGSGAASFAAPSGP